MKSSFLNLIRKSSIFKEKIYLQPKKLFENSIKTLLMFNCFVYIAKLKYSTILCEIPKKRKPYLGCSIRASDEIGMKIVLIKSDSPAERAGFRLGDTILSIDNHNVNNINDYNVAIGNKDGLKKVTIRRRKDKNIENDYLEIEIDVLFSFIEE